MVDDARDVYLYTVTSQLSFTVSDPDAVRRAALDSLLASERYRVLAQEQQRLERERVEESLANALLVLADPSAMTGDTPGVEVRSSRVTVKAGPADLDEQEG